MSNGIYSENEYIGIVVLHVAVNQVNSESSGKSAQTKRRNFHGTAIITSLLQMKLIFIVCSYSKNNALNDRND